jgi:hypothetical protein
MNAIGPKTKRKDRFLGLPSNIYSLGWVGFFMDVSSEMIYLSAHFYDLGTGGGNHSCATR